MFLKKRPEKLYSKNVFYNTTIRIVCQAYKVYFFELFFEIFCAVFVLLYICYIMVNSYSDSAKNFPLRGEWRVVPKQLSLRGVMRNADSSFPLRGVARSADSSFPLWGEWRRAETAFPFGESGA